MSSFRTSLRNRHHRGLTAYLVSAMPKNGIQRAWVELGKLLIDHLAPITIKDSIGAHVIDRERDVSLTLATSPP
jgi:hypothetical protein